MDGIFVCCDKIKYGAYCIASEYVRDAIKYLLSLGFTMDDIYFIFD